MNDPECTTPKRVEHLDNMLLLNPIQGSSFPTILIRWFYQRLFIVNPGIYPDSFREDVFDSKNINQCIENGHL